MDVTRIGRTVTCAVVVALSAGAQPVPAQTPPPSGKNPDHHVVRRSAEAVHPGTRSGREAEGHRRTPVLRAGGRQGQQLRPRLCGSGQHVGHDQGVRRRGDPGGSAGRPGQRRRAAHGPGPRSRDEGKSGERAVALRRAREALSQRRTGTHAAREHVPRPAGLPDRGQAPGQGNGHQPHVFRSLQSAWLRVPFPGEVPRGGGRVQEVPRS